MQRAARCVLLDVNVARVDMLVCTDVTCARSWQNPGWATGAATRPDDPMRFVEP